jgi:hypothetical protein
MGIRIEQCAIEIPDDILKIAHKSHFLFCQLFNSEEFIDSSTQEKSMIFIATAIPVKNFLEFLNK